MSKAKNPRFIVDLDSLLDTRLPTLLRMSPEYYKAVVDSGLYETRKSDDFSSMCGKIRYPEYKKMWDNRTTDYLVDQETGEPLVFMTNAIMLLRRLVTDQHGEMFRKGTIDQGVTVKVNAFPYVLSDEENSEFTDALSETIGGLAKVQVVYIDPETITPDYILEEGIDLLLLYDISRWLPAFLKKADQLNYGCPGVSAIIPRLTMTDHHYNELVELLQEQNKSADLFLGLQETLAPVISIDPADIKVFCIFDVPYIRSIEDAIANE